MSAFDSRLNTASVKLMQQYQLVHLIWFLHYFISLQLSALPGLKKIIWVIGVLRRTVVTVADVLTTSAKAIFIVKPLKMAFDSEDGFS